MSIAPTVNASEITHCNERQSLIVILDTRACTFQKRYRRYM